MWIWNRSGVLRGIPAHHWRIARHFSQKAPRQKRNGSSRVIPNRSLASLTRTGGGRYRLRDFTERDAHEKLGLPNEEGEPAPRAPADATRTSDAEQLSR